MHMPVFTYHILDLHGIDHVSGYFISTRFHTRRYTHTILLDQCQWLKEIIFHFKISIVNIFF